MVGWNQKGTWVLWHSLLVAYQLLFPSLSSLLTGPAFHHGSPIITFPASFAARTPACCLSLTNEIWWGNLLRTFGKKYSSLIFKRERREGKPCGNYQGVWGLLKICPFTRCFFSFPCPSPGIASGCITIKSSTVPTVVFAKLTKQKQTVKNSQSFGHTLVKSKVKYVGIYN